MQKGLRYNIIWLAGVISPLTVFIIITLSVIYGSALGIDIAFFKFEGRYCTAGIISAMKFITLLGSAGFLIPAYSILVLTKCFRKKYALALIIALTGIIGTVLFSSLKLFFKRPRPVMPLIQGMADYSYPSGHTLSAFLFFGVLVYTVWQLKALPSVKWVLSCLLLIGVLSVGLSRIVLRVHYLTDVLASVCLGITCLSLAFMLYKLIENKTPNAH